MRMLRSYSAPNYAEALWALDQEPGTLDLRAMFRDTLAALDQLPENLCSIPTEPSAKGSDALGRVRTIHS